MRSSIFILNLHHIHMHICTRYKKMSGLASFKKNDQNEINKIIE